MNLLFPFQTFAFFNSTSMCGCFGLLMIAALIVFLFFRKSKIDKAVVAFYQRNGIALENNYPQKVRNELGNGNWYCYAGTLAVDSGAMVRFYWWEGSISSIQVTGNSTQTTFDYFLAISFPPHAVSENFKQKAKALNDTSGKSAAEKAKDFFVLDTSTPTYADELPDGSFLMRWRVLTKAEIYQEKIDWLRANLETPQTNAQQSETIAQPARTSPQSAQTLAQNIETSAQTTATNAPPIAARELTTRVSYREIVETAPPDVRSTVQSLMNFLSSMNRDYHDTKGNPSLSFADHAAYLELTEAETAYFKSVLQTTAYTAEQLRAAGFTLPETDFQRNDAVNVQFPHRRMIYLVAQDIYLDLNEPTKAYISL